MVRALLLLFAVLGAAGCSGSGSAPPPPPDAVGPSAPVTTNPLGLEFRSITLPAAASPDGRDYRTAEYMAHWGLEGIGAEEAYQRGHFGQGVTIAIVDDGLDLAHPDLAGKIVKPRHIRYNNADVHEYRKPHGTNVALLAAARRGNAGGPFPVNVRDPEEPEFLTKNHHGVAPDALVMPVQISGSTPLPGIRHAASNGATVANLSVGIFKHYYGKLPGREGVWLTPPTPYFRPLVARDPYLLEEFSETAAALRGRDMVVVWGSGNGGWNSFNNQAHLCGKNFIGEDGCELGFEAVTAVEFMQGFEYLYEEHEDSPTISFREMWGRDCGEADCTDYNAPGGWSEAPFFEPGLLGKWLVVGAIQRGGRLSPFSNGCGAARNFCLVAPGEGLTIQSDDKEQAGTSYAAPHASGALAVLRSRMPGMPMEVVLAVLLYSADPLGTRVDYPDEPDPVYGWGRLNLGRAVTMQGSVRLPHSVADTTRTVSLKGGRINLSPALAHAAGSLANVRLAAGSVGRAYYNMKLGSIVDLRSGSSGPRQGNAARDMLGPAGGTRHESGPKGHGPFAETSAAREVHALGMDVPGGTLGRWRLRYNVCHACEGSMWRDWSSPDRGVSIPFFAHGEGVMSLYALEGGLRPFAAIGGRDSERGAWRQYGLRWRGQRLGYDVSAEFSRIDESNSLWGTRFGVLDSARTRTRQVRLSASGPLYRDWRGFVGYERLGGKVSTDGRFLSAVTGLEASGWAAGVRGRHVFREDDAVRFSVRRETGIRRGRAVVDHLVAVGGSFVDAFYRGEPQSLVRQRTVIPLRSPETVQLALGYALPVRNNTRLALGIEYDARSRNHAGSIELRHDF